MGANYVQSQKVAPPKIGRLNPGYVIRSLHLSCFGFLTFSGGIEM